MGGEGRKEKKCGSREKSVREREKKHERHFYTGHSVAFITSIELKERS